MASDLDRAARGRLRTLSKDNADGVARHLVMAGRLIDEDPELAYEHAQAAVRRAGRVDVVREAAALTAYRTGRYAEALRELRTVRRLNGSDEHLALMADCERGLGRPDRALALAQDDAARALPPETQVELAMVVSGARLDLGDADAALAALSTAVVQAASGELAERVVEAKAGALEAAGRSDEARALLAGLPGGGAVEEEIVVFDLEDDEPADSEASVPGDADNSDDPGVGDDNVEGETHVPSRSEVTPPYSSVPEHDAPDETDAETEAETDLEDARDSRVALDATADDERLVDPEGRDRSDLDGDSGTGGGPRPGDDGPGTDADADDAADAHGGTLF